VDFALVIGEGYYDATTQTPHPELDRTGQPGSANLVATATRARQVYQGRWKDLDGRPETGVIGRETCVTTPAGEPFTYELECPTLQLLEFEDTSCDQGSAWINADCDFCTPNSAHEGCEAGGCESLARWYPLDIPFEEEQTAGIAGPSRAKSSALQASVAQGRTVFSITPSASQEFARGAGTVSGQPLVPELEILDISGRTVTNLRGSSDSKEIRWSWDQLDRHGKPAPSGVYFARAAGGAGSIGLRGAVARFVIVR
jgi:hypothetical protein